MTQWPNSPIAQSSATLPRMDHLFTPWRYQYMAVAGKDEGKAEKCIFCRALAEENDRESLIVHRGRDCFVVLNKFPYTNGHLMIAPFEHLDELQKLRTSAAHEMIELAQQAERAFRKLYKPDGINLGMNIGRAAGAGVVGHVHLHALPRWIADSNFMTTVGETRVLPESLEQTWEKLHGSFSP
jgi:ATP adenylyltransferase